MKLASVVIVALSLTGAKALHVKSPSPSWSVSASKDAISDEETFSATIRGDKGLLAFSCKVGDMAGTRVLVGSDEILGSGIVRAREVTYRVDSQEAVDDTWVYTAQAAMIRNPTSAMNFMTSVVTSKALLVRLYDVTERQHDIKFDVTRSRNCR